MSVIDKLLALSPPMLRSFKPGELLFSQGDVATSLFIIQSGAVEVFQSDDADDELDDGADHEPPGRPRVTLTLVGRNDLIGEVEMLQRALGDKNVARMFSVRALAAGHATQVSYARIAQDLHAGTELHGLLVRRMVMHVQTLATAIELARFGTPERRLATVLLQRAKALGVRSPSGGRVVRFEGVTSQRELEEAVGLGHTFVSTTLKAWERAGIVRAGRDQQFFITDLPRIALIAAARRHPGKAKHDDALVELDSLIAAGENFRARNLALHHLRHFPHSLELRYRSCLAAARAGAFAEGQKLAEQFGLNRGRLSLGVDHRIGNETADPDEASTARDADRARLRLRQLTEDASALLARIDKDIAFASSSDATRQTHLERAYTGYDKLFRETGGAFPAINAASLARLIGRVEQSRRLASAILLKLRTSSLSYWSLATAGEAYALLDAWPEAREALAQAACSPDAAQGMMASTRLQLLRLRAALDHDEIDLLLETLPAPTTLVFSGHMMRGAQMDARAQQAGQAALLDQLDPMLRGTVVGDAYGALACGSDIIIAERLLKQKVRLHVVLPMRFPDFIEESVRIGDPSSAPGRSWIDRFDECLARADSVTIVHDHKFEQYESEALFHHAFCNAAGLALLRADELVGPAAMVAVHDGGPADSIAGTGMAIRMWEPTRRPVTVLNCSWRQADATKVDATLSTPCRAVVFAWPVLDAHQAAALRQAEQQGDAAGLATRLVTTLTTCLARFSGKVGTSSRVIKNRLRVGAFGVFDHIEDAENAALSLVVMKGDPFAGMRVVCDFGLVLDRQGRIDMQRLNRLRAAEPNDEVPMRVAVATEAFAANARLRGVGSKRYQPMGTLDQGDDSFAPGVPAPSIKYYRLS